MTPDAKIAMIIIGGILFLSGYITAHNTIDIDVYNKAFVIAIIGLIIFFIPIFASI